MDPSDTTEAQEAISDVAVCQSPFDAMVLLAEQPANPTRTADRADVSRTTAHRWLDTLLERGWARLRDDHQYELTAGGNTVLNVCNRCFEQIGREAVAALARSPYAVRVLRALDSESTAIASIVDDEDAPSRSTVTRLRNRFEGEGWVSREQGEYELTSAGKRALNEYERVAETMELVTEKRPFLEGFRADGAVPIGVLRESSVIETNPERKLRGKPLTAFTEEITPSLDRVRGIVPVVNPAYIRAVRPLLGSKTQLEFIVDRTVLANARLEYKDVLVESFTAENLDMYVTLEDVSIGVAVFDDEKAQIGAYDDDYAHRATLEGTAEAVVDWADKLYDSYRADAQLVPDVTTVENAFEKLSNVVIE